MIHRTNCPTPIPSSLVRGTLVALVCATFVACGNNTADSGRTTHDGSAEAELLDRRVTMDQVLQRFKDADTGRVSRAIVQLVPMSSRTELHGLLRAVWERDRASFPDLNWSVLETERVRISVARVLGEWESGDARYREYVVAMADHAESRNDQVEALIALGSIGNAADIERLEAIAIGEDDLLATGALAGLVASNRPTAIRTVEDIATNAAVPDDRRKLARQLLAMPRPDV